MKEQLKIQTLASDAEVTLTIPFYSSSQLLSTLFLPSWKLLRKIVLSSTIPHQVCQLHELLLENAICIININWNRNYL